MAKKKITETDVEAKIHNSLKMVFPWIDDTGIKHQTSFSVKLGHNTKDVNNIDLEGRSDIIIYKDQKPLFVCELKAPDIKLSDDDAQQGFSYAKVHDPFVPIVVVTNTTDVKVYETYTGRLIDDESDSAKDLSFFVKKINLAAQAAKESFEDVIRVLSGGKNKEVVELYKKKNDTTFQFLEGSSEVFDHPIQTDSNCILNREIVDEIEHFNVEKNFTLIEGKALFGKTNIAFLLSEKLSKKEISNIYIDLETSAGLYSEIESVLSDYYSTSFGKTQIKEWIRSFIKSNPFVILIDNADVSSFEKNESEIKELLGIFKGSNCRIILFVNKDLPCYNFSSKGRSGANALTNLIEKKEINCINSREFRNSKSKVLKPIVYCLFPELKYPLFFRAAQWSGLQNEKDSFFDIVVNALEALNSSFPSAESEQDFFDKFFEFYFDEYKFKDKSSDEKVVAELYKRVIPCILRNVMIEKFEKSCVDEVVRQGLFSREKHSDADFICLRKPLFLINDLYEFFIKRLKKNFPKELTYLLNKCDSIPSGDVIAAYSLYQCIKTGVVSVMEVLDNLFEKQPKVDDASDVVGAMYENNTLINLKLDGGVLLSNQLPWRVLTLLLSKTDINNVIPASKLREYLTKLIFFKHGNTRFTGLSINCVEYDQENGCPRCRRHELQDPLVLALLTTKKMNSWYITILQNDTKMKACVQKELEKLKLLEKACEE